MKELPLQEIKSFIEEHGPTEVSRRTRISRRTLQYILSGARKPTFPTMEKLLEAMGKRA
jgi:DNA-binding phage protein